MDDCEHATGKPLGRHMEEVAVLHPRTPKEIARQEIERYLEDRGGRTDKYGTYIPGRHLNARRMADIVLKALKDGGYSIVERVSVYK